MKKTILLTLCLSMAGLLAVNGTFAFTMTEVVSNLFTTVTDWITGDAAKPYEGGGFDVNIVYLDSEGNILTNGNTQQLLPGGTVEQRISVRNVSQADEGKNPPSAFFRIALAIQDEIADQLTLNINETHYKWNALPNIRIGTTDYRLLVATYCEKLMAGATAPAATLSVSLNENVTSTQLSRIRQDFLQVQVMAIDADSFANALANGNIQPLEGQSEAEAVLDKALPLTSNFNPFE